MKKSLLLIALCAGLLATSCTTVTRIGSGPTAAVANAGVRQLPTVAELDVQGQRVKKSDTWQWRLFGAQTLLQRKDNLIASILDETKGDVLLEPLVSVERRWFGPTKLTISGYPANFKNFHTASAEELEALQKVEPVHKRRLFEVSLPFQKSAEPKAKPSKQPKTTDGKTPSYLARDSRFRFMFGANFITRSGFDPYYYDYDYGKTEGVEDDWLGGLDLSIDYRKYFKSSHHWFWGAKFGLRIGTCPLDWRDKYSGDIELSDDITLTTSLVPFRLGYNFKLGSKTSLYLQAGPMLNWHFLNDWEYGPDRFYRSGVDAGIDFGVGFQWKRFSVEVAPALTFMRTCCWAADGTTQLGVKIGWDL